MRVNTYLFSISLVLGPALLGVGCSASEAELAFQPLLAEFAEYEQLQFPQERAALEKVMAQKLAWNSKLSAEFDAFAVDAADVEWQTAALYYKALTFKRHGEAWVQSPVPFDRDDPDEAEDFATYTDQLTVRAKPFEQTADAVFERVVDFANQQNIQNWWVAAALLELEN